nr:hypothetical protein [Tanacetum cinerariifolium]
MSTRSTSSNLFPSLRDPDSLIRQRKLGEPSSLFDFEEVMSIPHNNQGPPPARPLPPQNNNGPPSVGRPNEPAPHMMEELCQPSINGWGGPIAIIPIQATDFGLHHHMIQQVQNYCQFHGLPSDDANRHIDKFLEVTQHMKQNRVFDDALRLSLFPYSLTYHATTWYDCLPRKSIHTFDHMMRKFLSKYFSPSMVTKLRNEIMKFRQDPNESLFEAREHYKLSIDRFADALLHIPKFASTFKSLLSNKEKLFELASTPLNKNCSVMLLKKLPKKLGDPEEALAPRTYSDVHDSKACKPIVDYDVDPRVPLILERPFFRMARALIDVHGEELTL